MNLKISIQSDWNSLVFISVIGFGLRTSGTDPLVLGCKVPRRDEYGMYL